MQSDRELRRETRPAVRILDGRALAATNGLQRCPCVAAPRRNLTAGRRDQLSGRMSPVHSRGNGGGAPGSPAFGSGWANTACVSGAGTFYGATQPRFVLQNACGPGARRYRTGGYCTKACWRSWRSGACAAIRALALRALVRTSTETIMRRWTSTEAPVSRFRISSRMASAS